MNVPNTGSDAANPFTNDQPWHRWQDWVNLILGIWLFISPWIWHSTTALGATAIRADWNCWILGVIVVIIALCALATPASSAVEWLNAIAGIWLFIAPWVLSFSTATRSLAWDSWIVGIIVFVLSVWAASSLRAHPHTGGMHTGGMQSS